MLLIINRPEGRTCVEIARAMWPKSKAKGNRVAAGAGPLLAQLRALGFVVQIGRGHFARFFVAPAGRAFLENFRRDFVDPVIATASRER